MDKIKTILILIAIILGGLAVLAGIGLVYSLLNYILVFAALCLGGYVAVKLLSKPEPNEIKAPNPRKELKNWTHSSTRFSTTRPISWTHKPGPTRR